MSYLDQFRAARRSAAPIIVVRTSDFTTVINDVKKFYTDKNVPILQWDVSRGIMGSNKLGAEAATAINANDQEQPPAMVTGNPTDALQKAIRLLPSGDESKGQNGAILFMMNLQIILESRDDARISVIQGVWNCRDEFKSSNRTLVLLCPDLKVPPELSNDVVILDMPLPTKADLGTIVESQFKAAGLKKPEQEITVAAVDAITGLSSFAAEQVTAMSLSQQGLDLSAMWDRKRSIIRQTGGLNVYSGPRVTFDDLGGLAQLKKYLRMIIAGKRPPRLVVLMDEIEKQMGGSYDSTGVNMDAIGQLLTGIQDNGWDGTLWPGFPGSGKTELGKAMGFEAGGLFLTLDMGGMKDKYVGNSEKMVRAALAMLKAMGGENVFFIGTCNSMAVLKPELKRRFAYGTFFFDLPTQEEQLPIWKIHLRNFDIKQQQLPKCPGWTGAEIKSCCKRADEFKVSLVEAAKYVSPVIKSMGDQVLELRKSAHQKYLSATNEGYYDMNNAITETAIDEIKNIQPKE